MKRQSGNRKNELEGRKTFAFWRDWKIQGENIMKRNYKDTILKKNGCSGAIQQRKQREKAIGKFYFAPVSKLLETFVP